ncbi:MAG: ABC transporter ATP-binding protein [Clostridiales bacterium]|nr:ABC transporter ATP-binding protein [Clostridiales bacterium]
MKKQGLLSVLGRVLRTSGWMTPVLVLVIAGAVAAALYPPLVLEQIVDSLTSGQPVLLQAALLYLGALAAAGVLEAAQNVMITVFGQRITHALRSEMCAKLRRLPTLYFIRNDPGRIVSRFVNDVDVVDSLFTNGIVSMFADACKVLSILVVIFYKSTGLGILMLLATPLLMLLTHAFQKRMLQAQLDNRVAVEKVNNHIPETLRNIRMIHSFSAQGYMEQKYDEYILESYRATERSNLYDALYSPIIVFSSSLMISVLMVCASMGGGMRQFFGITVGTAVAVIAYVGKVFEPLENIGMEIQNIQSALAGVRRINEFLREEERVLPEDRKEDANADEDSCIRFEHLRFGYDPDHPVLQDLELQVDWGETVTIAGRTGAGKSTLFRLALGLYEPDSGRVLVQGRDAAAIQDGEKRKLFGYVEQTFRPVPGTVADQIALFDDSITSGQVETAARLTGLHESILALEQGYDTPMSAAPFSQGQLQLLSIARALAASPRILLLDEITANLDSETEAKVLRALENAAQGRTVISISHRLQEKLFGGKILWIGEPVSSMGPAGGC